MIRPDSNGSIIKQHQVLAVCVGNAVAHSITGGLRVKTIDACRSAEQPRDGMEWGLTGVRLAEGGEHLHIACWVDGNP